MSAVVLLGIQLARNRMAHFGADDEELPVRVAYENLKTLGEATQKIKTALLANRANFERQLGTWGLSCRCQQLGASPAAPLNGWRNPRCPLM